MVDVDGDDDGAFAQKPVGDCASQTTGCAGDDSDEVIEPHVFGVLWDLVALPAHEATAKPLRTQIQDQPNDRQYDKR